MQGIKKWVLIVILVFLNSHVVLAGVKYTFEPDHSFVEWYIDHLGFSTYSGKWPFKGTVELNEAEPQKSKVSVTISTAHVITGVPKLDEHLQAPLFFDTKQYPVATFVSHKVILKNQTTAEVQGTLTLKGVSKPVVLKIVLNKLGENPISDKITAGFSGTTQIKRSEFGLTAFLPGLSDEVRIHIEAEAQK